MPGAVEARRQCAALLLAVALALGTAAITPASAHDGREDKQSKKDQAKDKQQGATARPTPEDLNREVSHVLSRMKFSLEGGNAHDFLALIDCSRFEGYPRFKDTIERLMRDDIVRVFLQVATTSLNAADGEAQTILDAEMEVTRHDAAVDTQIRRHQLVLDFVRTPNGWRIANITPRSYFDLL